MKNQTLNLGDKNIFSIVIHSNQNPSQIGEIQFWVNNCCIGRKEKTFILPNLVALKKINDLSSFSLLNIYENSIDSIFNEILKNEILSNKTLLGFGETFDEYLLRIYKYNSEVIFLWTFSPNLIKKDKNEKRKVQCEIIQNDYFDKILNESFTHFKT